jgi:hypothetical protein
MTTYTVLDRKTGQKKTYTIEDNLPVNQTTQPAETVESKVDKL